MLGGRAGRARRRATSSCAPGDVALIRLGSGALFNDTERYLAAGGVTADGSRWLAERKPFAVGADNVAFDAVDGHDPELGSIPGHTILIVQHGIHIIESLYPGGARGRRRARVRLHLPAAEVPRRDRLPVRPIALV